MPETQTGSAEDEFGKETVQGWAKILEQSQTMRATAALDPDILRLVNDIRDMLWATLASSPSLNMGQAGRIPPHWDEFTTKLAELDKAIETALTAVEIPKNHRTMRSKERKTPTLPTVKNQTWLTTTTSQSRTTIEKHE